MEKTENYENLEKIRCVQLNLKRKEIPEKKNKKYRDRLEELGK